MTPDELRERIQKGELQLNPGRQNRPVEPDGGVTLGEAGIGRGRILRMTGSPVRHGDGVWLTLRIWCEGFPAPYSSLAFRAEALPGVLKMMVDVMDKLIEGGAAICAKPSTQDGGNDHSNRGSAGPGTASDVNGSTGNTPKGP